jgi:enoyl-CoA hydratase
VFGFPEVSLGAVPGWMGCERLLSLVGRARSRELILLGEPITAARALDWGIVNEIAPTHRLDERVAQVCELIERRSSTSLSVSKRLLRSVESGQPELSHEFAASVCKASIDAQEGVRAFKEKRPAKFR